MKTESMIPARTERADLVTPEIVNMLDDYLSSMSKHTKAAYLGDLRDFCRFLGDVEANGRFAAQVLIAGGKIHGQALVLNYRRWLVERGLSAATVNRRIAALRSVVKLARTVGLVNWSLEVKGLKSEAYRDTRGPGVDGFHPSRHSFQAY